MYNVVLDNGKSFEATYVEEMRRYEDKVLVDDSVRIQMSGTDMSVTQVDAMFVGYNGAMTVKNGTKPVMTISGYPNIGSIIRSAGEKENHIVVTLKP